MNTKKVSCKIYYSLLAICYLEVVLWTACLLTSCATLPASAALDSHNYLLRETGNLKYAGNDFPPVLPVIDPIEVSWQLQLEHLYSQRLLESLLLASPEVIQPQLFSLRIAQDFKGLPAPFTGIKALS